MDIRNQTKKRAERGAVSAQLLILLVPVFFAFMGFAVDLGRLYLIRGELKDAANSMALAAAQKLIGTDLSTADATTSARLAITSSSGFANKYDFGSRIIGDSVGNISSDAPDPTYYDSVVSAVGAGDAAGASEAGSSTAKHVRVTMTADAPLLFWSFLALGQSQKTTVAAKAVAGMSAPLCTACGIEAIAIQAVDAGDTTDFGLIKDTRYTFGYVCTGVPSPGLLSGTTARLDYLILNRLNQDATLFPDENSQLFRIGAQGLPGSTTTANACFMVNANEQVWATAAPRLCSLQNVQAQVGDVMCGLSTRFDPTVQTACASVPEVDTISSAYVADADVSDLDAYASYTGNMRRVITVPVVDALSATGTMTVLGFRQFLLEPNQGTTNINVTDFNARFVGLYIGSVVPLKQGAFSGCQITAGPGKVVLHQ